jgi:hypothetical protein
MHGRLLRQRFVDIRFFILFLLLIIVFLLNSRGLFDVSPSTSSIILSCIVSTVPDATTRKSLVRLGKKYRTSKGRIHHYTRFYQRYLKKYRDTNFHLLEIGLGCGMPWGVGASAAMWREYFGPKANIHFIEYDKQCGDEWMNESGREVNLR